MLFSDISNSRLASQHIAIKTQTTVKDVVGYMVAMQAQDYAMAKLAVGIRLSDTTDKVIEAAISNGDIIRTHLLRPTWHLVSADDIYWLLELTAPHVKNLLKSRHKELELSGSVLTAIYTIIQNELRDGNHLTREELISIIEKANFSMDDNRAYHILLRAELDGILSSGSIKGNKQTYALLNERVPKTIHLTREEALGKLARKYFTSHGPATLQDFVWWSGLSVTDARKALGLIKDDLISESIDIETYWYTNTCSNPLNKKDGVYLLPAFDEFLISYKNRRASIVKDNQIKAIYQNGIFRPVIVIGGQIEGTWKRTMKKEKVIIETDFFQPHSKSIEKFIEHEAGKIGCFLGKEVEVIYNSYS